MNLSERGANAAVAALSAQLDGGTVEMLDGGGEVLAVFGLATPAFRSPTGGEAEAYPLKPEPSAKATGKPSTYRTVAADGHEVTSGPVSREGGELTFKPEFVVQYAEVMLDRFVLRVRGVS